MTAIRERQQAMITDLDIPKLSVHKSYGQRPEDIMAVYIDAGNNIPTLGLKAIPGNHASLNAISECAFKRFGKAAKCLRYRGEVASVVGDRIRLYCQKVKRSRFDATNILHKQHGKCKMCDKELDEEWDLDHVQRLADGGKDVEENIAALCLTCHQEKTSIENGSRLYHKNLYSTFSVDVQDDFLALQNHSKSTLAMVRKQVWR
jgi:5-methylcytosine-specific restriction endonuclease McrA